MQRETTSIEGAVARPGCNELALESLELDAIRSDELLVKLSAVGICHTDHSVLAGHFPMPLPMVLGHEGAGVVVAAGATSGHCVGDHVVLSFSACGECPSCDSHHPAYCEQFAALNYRGRRTDGSPTILDDRGEAIGGAFFGQSSFATHAIVRGRDAIVVPEHLPLRSLAGFGCAFITGAGTVMNVLKPSPGSHFAILGAGALGFAAMFAAQIAGCGTITVVDRVASRLELAIEVGANRVIDTSGCAIEDAFTNLDFDYIIDTTGAGSLVSAAITRLARRGTCALVGGGTDRMVTVDILGLIPGKSIVGVIEGDSDPHDLIPKLVEFFRAGLFPVDRLMRFYPLDRINEAMSAGVDGTVIKPVITFD